MEETNHFPQPEETEQTASAEGAAEPTAERPIVVCNAELTRENYEKITQAMLKKQKPLHVLNVVCGGIIFFSGILRVLIEYAFAQVFELPVGSVLFGGIGAAVLVFGILMLAPGKKRLDKAYDRFLRNNPDTAVHMEFYADRVVAFDQYNRNTYFYDKMNYWAESDDLYLLYFGGKLQEVAAFVLKEGFATREEANAFFQLMTDVMAGKKYKRL